MPYVAISEASASEGAQAALSVPMPAHKANDILVAIVGQDGGGTTIVATDWTQIGTQAAAQNQRTTAFWRLATNDNMPDLALSGANDDWSVSIVVVRGADTTTPINAELRTNSANSATAYLDSGVLTTDEDGCLILYAWGFDGGSYLNTPPTLVPLTRVRSSAAHCLVVGYKNKLTLGACPDLRATNSAANEGGQALVIAINDATPSAPSMGMDVVSDSTILFNYGAHGVNDTVTFEALGALTATTIAGVDVSDDFNAPTTGAGATNSPWGAFTHTTNFSVTAGNGIYFGVSHAIPSTSFEGKIFSIEHSVASLLTSRVGVNLIIAVFEDASGNWAAFLLQLRTGAVIDTAYRTFIDPSNSTPFDSSGAIDWGAVTRIGYGLHRTATVTNGTPLYFKAALLCDPITLVGGCPAAPVRPTIVSALGNESRSAIQLASLQGTGQVLAKQSIQLGDGVTPTYVDFGATSYELPIKYDNFISKRFWKVEPDSIEFRIKASATDTIKLANCVIVTDTRQLFIIDAASSPLATYDFSGASFIGWHIENNVSGVEIRDATFKLCHGITLNGGKLASIVTESIADPAVITNNPGNILDCDFTTDGTGHAIEITATGTYSFVGNRFYDYGADGTADAAIHNTSGGLVTLNVSSGDTPTVKNGPGSTTVINNSVTLHITGVFTGSDVVIYDADIPSTGDASNVLQTYNEIAGTSVDYVYNYASGLRIKIGVFKPGFIPQESPAITLTSFDSEIPIKLQPDRAYV